ncbi:cytochrome P450 [Novosphingobium album (ex Hu et al. 2023)]|uniref:Cytochrome P450 n=1 Tax=Novosphingobium album (ex Hu et al. 2023) TaxID=2930093 RepID=A0ABT0AWH1_9SPHN|nr:cytochrome P450 [Novosphingobium album (ex Hu et al. 2023)]MCJ2176953.1 cytochrome P450 [Novosphingobium album (ex Hu et al. 2023)]
MSAPFATAERVPETVPSELVWDRDFDTFTLEGDDPFVSIARLYQEAPVIWGTEANFKRPGWILTRDDVIREAFIDYEHFSSERPGMIADMLGEPILLNPIEIDPPRHHQYRKILNPFFTPAAIRSYDEPVRKICRELIAKFRDRGECEFVDEFAVPFPSYVFLDLMDMPRALLDQFMGWQDELMRAPDPMVRIAAARSIYGYLKQHMEAQQANPTNDLLRGIVTGQVEDRPMNYYEMMGMFYVLYVGGLDTVYSTIGWIMQHLAKDAVLQQRLRANPDLLPQAVEEFCRAYSVVITHRAVTKDFTFQGVPMKKGDEVNMPIMLANRDPSVYADPHTVDIDRKPRHIAFGTGTHNCVGVNLAKREMRIVIEEFLKAFVNIRIKPGEMPRYHTGRTFGLDYLPLVWG